MKPFFALAAFSHKLMSQRIHLRSSGSPRSVSGTLQRVLKFVSTNRGRLHLKSESYIEHSRTSKTELFTKTISGFQPLIIFTKSSILFQMFNWVLNTLLKLFVSYCLLKSNQLLYFYFEYFLSLLYLSLFICSKIQAI